MPPPPLLPLLLLMPPLLLRLRMSRAELEASRPEQRKGYPPPGPACQVGRPASGTPFPSILLRQGQAGPSTSSGEGRGYEKKGLSVRNRRVIGAWESGGIGH